MRALGLQVADASHPAGDGHESERRAARRVLRVARLRTTGGRSRGKSVAGAAAATLLALLAVGLWKQLQGEAPAQRGAERAVDDGASRTRDTDSGVSVGAGEPLDITIEIVAAPARRPAPLQRTEAPADDPGAPRVPPPVNLASVDAAAGLRIVNTVAGNRFGLRASDVIVDLCDRPGPETALEMSHALATDASSCLTVFRDNALVRAEPGGPARDEANPAGERGAGPEL